MGRRVLALIAAASLGLVGVAAVLLSAKTRSSIPRRAGRLLLRRSGQADRGAVTALVALLLGSFVILGFGALAVDVGAIYAERRVVQNGADAVALAVAANCAKNSACTTDSSLASLAGANAGDGVTALDSVCGSPAARVSNPGLTACAAPTGRWTDCPPVPAGPSPRYVEARTSTLNKDGTTVLPPWFAQALTGYQGAHVPGCARAGWFALARAHIDLPIIFSYCNWRRTSANGSNYPPNPPYNAANPAPASREVVLAEDEPVAGVNSDCQAWTPEIPPGTSHQIPEGFRWLSQNPSCGDDAVIGRWYSLNEGYPGGQCNDLPNLPNVNRVIWQPIFDCKKVTTPLLVCDPTVPAGAGNYHVLSFAPFYLTGYQLGSDFPARPPMNPANTNCGKPAGYVPPSGANNYCLYGWFLSGALADNAKYPADPTAPITGLSVIKMLG